MAADPALAFSQNLVKSYIQFKLAERQYDLFERREKRYGAQLQANQRWQQQQATAVESRFTRTEERLAVGAKSLEQLRGRPRRGTTEDFISQGYGPETAQRLQDQEVGLISRPSTPYQRVTAGKMMMENATTTDMFNAGKQIMEEAMVSLKGQVAFPSRAGEAEPQGGEAGEATAFPTRAPGDKSTPITKPPIIDDFFGGEFETEAGQSIAFPSSTTRLNPANEEAFQKEYARVSSELNLDPNPDDPKHFYDYRGLFKETGRLDFDESGHFPSKFKREGHPNLIVDGVNTKTGQPAVSPELEIIPGEEPIAIAEWGPIAEKAQRNGIEVIEIYRAAAKFKGLNLSKEEMLTALDKLAEGATAEQIIEFLKSGVSGSQ